MKHLHFDCFSGVSGDMLLGALVDVGLPLSELIRGLKAVKLSGYALRAATVKRGGGWYVSLSYTVASVFQCRSSSPMFERT